jgi:hypothetical protein
MIRIMFLKLVNPYDILKNSRFIWTAVTRGQPLGGNRPWVYISKCKRQDYPASHAVQNYTDQP